MSLSGKIDMATSLCPEANEMMVVTPVIKRLLMTYIDQLDRSDSLANHTLGMNHAFSAFSSPGAFATHPPIRRPRKEAGKVLSLAHCSRG